MNDPLRDNRIFPEEMHEVIQKREPIHHTYFWQWFTLGSIFILLLFWAAFSYYQERVIVSARPVDTEQKEQLAVYNKLQDSRLPMTREEREDKINTLFGNQ